MQVNPFKGFRFNSDVVGNAADCVSPPYDVIDPALQDILYAKNECNTVRIIKGKKSQGDSETSNVYTRAADHLNAYIEKEALKQDGNAMMYVYGQEFTIEGVTYQRNGFIALGKLEAYGGKIKPHEQTLAGPKADRLNLTRAIKTQVGQIFMLYSEKEQKIDAILNKACQGALLLAHTDEDGVIHKLYGVSDGGDLQTISDVMESRSVFIADGHHRYETALNYYEETKNPNAAFQLMTFVNTHNEGLVVLATHRLMKNVEGFDAENYIEKLASQFDVARFAFVDNVDKKAKFQQMIDGLKYEFANNQHAFGMYFGNGAYFMATLRDVADMATVGEGYSDDWQKLDVSILHKLMLEQHLGIDEAALTAQTNVKYIKDYGDATMAALDRVDDGEYQGMFIMNPTRIEEVEAVAMAGEKMPQKSTFFFPKIYSGLVMNVIDKG
jgi:uncharacterized protein (DUF1015 family)